MSQNSNKCSTFLSPQPNKYKDVEIVDELNIGVLNASKKLFELGVKYTKDILITVTTAETTILVETSLKTMEHFIDKLKENPRVNEIISTQMPKLFELFNSSANIIRYIGYDYLTKSYYNYASANKPYINDNVLTQDGIGFKKLLELASQTQTQEGGHNKDAYNIVDRLTDQILKIEDVEKQHDALLKIKNMIEAEIKKKENHQKGGKSKTKKRYRNIRKMIKRTIRKFCNSYQRITK